MIFDLSRYRFRASMLKAPDESSIMCSGFCRVRSQSMMARVIPVPVRRMLGCMIWRTMATVTSKEKKKIVMICFFDIFDL